MMHIYNKVRFCLLHAYNKSNVKLFFEILCSIDYSSKLTASQSTYCEQIM